MSITFEVFQEDAGFVAKWDAPMNMGGITTQADSLPELFKAITEAVQCHFDEEEMPKEAKLHFVNDPALDLREAA
jgi:predicted RNase H-like HicB family nuclease